MKKPLLQIQGLEPPTHSSIQELVGSIDFPEGIFDIEKDVPDECALGKTRNNEHYVVVIRSGDGVRTAKFVQHSAERVLLAVMKLFGLNLSMHEVKLHIACIDGGSLRRSDCQVQAQIQGYDQVFGSRGESELSHMEAALSASFETLRNIYLYLEKQREAEKSVAA